MGLRIFGRIFVAVFASAGLLLFAIDSNAQTKRRKRTTTSSARVLPIVPQTEPMIISRAEDFPDSDSQMIEPKPLEKLETAASTAESNAKAFEDLTNRIKTLEAGRKKDPDEKQKRLLMNLDILTKAEQRAETLRKQLFDMIEKESTIKTRLDLIENDIRPEAIDRSVAFAGTLRPEELRNMRRKNLEIEKTNLQSLLVEIQRTRANLDQNVQKADILVDKLRVKLEKEIDDALADEPKNL